MSRRREIYQYSNANGYTTQLSLHIIGPHPSYRFDRFMAQQLKKHWEQEHLREVAKWSSEVTSDVD